MTVGILAALGAGLVTIGAAFGIGKIGSASVEGAARQPEAAGNIQTMMIISAALIEGVGLFSAVVCLMAVLSNPKGHPPAKEAPVAAKVADAAH